MDLKKHNTLKVKCHCQNEIEFKFPTHPDTMIHDSKFEMEECVNSVKTTEYLMGMEDSVLEKDMLCGNSVEACHSGTSQSTSVPIERADIADSKTQMEIVSAKMDSYSPLLEKSKKADKCITARIVKKLNHLIKLLQKYWKFPVGLVALGILTALVLIYVPKLNSLHPPEQLQSTTSPVKKAVSYINSPKPTTILSLVRQFEGTLLILSGGEKKGRLVNTVELYPAYIKSCLPDLPEELKWGSMELLGNNLLACGGQNRAEQPVKSCWILVKENNGESSWIHHTDLIRPRSQFASAVVGDGSVLSILSGYSPVEEGWGIPSMQIVKIDGPGEEHKLTIPGTRGDPYTARMASAAALSTKKILLTGGKGMEKDVFLLSGPGLTNWQRQKGMQQGRFCHSSIVIVLGGEETVLVAGGWNEKGQALNSVELFSVEQNQWEFIEPLPSPRVDFSLQVINSKIMAIGGYYETKTTRVYPGVVTMNLAATGNLSFWSQEAENHKQHNGFMATKVSISWLKQMCNYLI